MTKYNEEFQAKIDKKTAELMEELRRFDSDGSTEDRLASIRVFVVAKLAELFALVDSAARQARSVASDRVADDLRREFRRKAGLED